MESVLITIVPSSTISATMKVGIITFWDSSDNYGQQLQCWALQHVLIRLKHEPFLIRYIPVKSQHGKSSLWEMVFKIILIYPIAKRVIWGLKKKKEDRLIALNIERNKKRSFKEFRDTEIVQSEHIFYGLAELQNNPPEADAYICGSDQVWGNPLINGGNDENTSYFLNFGKHDVKRISYAASFGMEDYPNNLKGVLESQLKRFDSVSCREVAGVSICNSVKIKASHVLDPTLLLTSSYYKERLHLIKQKTGPYIYIYSLNMAQPSDIQWKELKSYSTQNALEIIVTPSSGYMLADEIFDGVSYEYATIPEWISLIKDSSLFIASSFHGIVFSILFHRPFVYAPVKGRWAKGNNRVLELLHFLHLESRILHGESSYQTILEDRIDWNQVDAILNEKRLISNRFLIESL